MTKLTTPVAVDYKAEKSLRGDGLLPTEYDYLKSLSQSAYNYEKIKASGNKYLDKKMWSAAALRGETEILTKYLEDTDTLENNEYLQEWNAYDGINDYDGYMLALSIPYLDDENGVDRIDQNTGYLFGNYTDKKWAESILYENFSKYDASQVESNKENMSVWQQGLALLGSSNSRLAAGASYFTQDVFDLLEGLLNMALNENDDDSIGSRFLWAFSNNEGQPFNEVADFFSNTAFELERRYTSVVDAEKAYESGYRLGEGSNFFSQIDDATGVTQDGYTSWGKYWAGTLDAIGYMIPTIALAAVTGGASAAGTAGSGAAAGTAGALLPSAFATSSASAALGAAIAKNASQAIFYSGIFSGMVSDTVMNASANGVSYKDLNAGEVVTNAALKSVAQLAIEKALGCIMGFSGLDKMIGTAENIAGNSSIATTIKAGQRATATGLKAAGYVAADLAKDVLKEGLEETLQTLSDVAIDNLFGGEYAELANQGFTLQNLVDSFVIGGLMSGVMGSISTLRTPRVTGIDDKTNEAYKLGKFQSINFSKAMSDFYELHETLNSQTASKEKVQDAALKMHLIGETVGSVLGQMGPERAAMANKILKENIHIDEKNKKIKKLYSDVTTNTANQLFGKLMLATVDTKLKLVEQAKKKVQERLAAKDGTKEKLEKGKTSEVESVVTSSEIIEGTETDSTKKSEIQKILSELGVEYIVGTDGNYTFKSDDVIFTNHKLITNGEISTILQGVAFDAAHTAVLNTLSPLQKQIITQRFRRYAKNTDGTLDEALDALIFDKFFYTNILLNYGEKRITSGRGYNQKGIEILLSIDKVINEVLNKKNDNLSTAATKQLVLKIQKNMRAGVVAYATQYVNTDLSKISGRIIDKNVKAEIENHQNVYFTNSINALIKSIGEGEIGETRLKLFDSTLDKILTSENEDMIKEAKKEIRSSKINDRVDAASILNQLIKEHGITDNMKLIYLPSTSDGIISRQEMTKANNFFFGDSAKSNLLDLIEGKAIITSKNALDFIKVNGYDLQDKISRYAMIRTVLYDLSNGSLTLSHYGEVMEVIQPDQFFTTDERFRVSDKNGIMSLAETSRKFTKVLRESGKIPLKDLMNKVIFERLDKKSQTAISKMSVEYNEGKSSSYVDGQQTISVGTQSINELSSLMHEITHFFQFITSRERAEDGKLIPRGTNNLGGDPSMFKALPKETAESLDKYLNKNFPLTYNYFKNMDIVRENGETSKVTTPEILYFMLDGELKANSYFTTQIFDAGFTWRNSETDKFNNRAVLVSPDGKSSWSMKVGGADSLKESDMKTEIDVKTENKANVKAKKKVDKTEKPSDQISDKNLKAISKKIEKKAKDTKEATTKKEKSKVIANTKNDNVNKSIEFVKPEVVKGFTRADGNLLTNEKTGLPYVFVRGAGNGVNKSKKSLTEIIDDKTETLRPATFASDNQLYGKNFGDLTYFVANSTDIEDINVFYAGNSHWGSLERFLTKDSEELITNLFNDHQELIKNILLKDMTELQADELSTIKKLSQEFNVSDETFVASIRLMYERFLRPYMHYIRYGWRGIKEIDYDLQYDFSRIGKITSRDQLLDTFQMSTDSLSGLYTLRGKKFVLLQELEEGYRSIVTDLIITKNASSSDIRMLKKGDYKIDGNLLNDDADYLKEIVSASSSESLKKTLDKIDAQLFVSLDTYSPIWNVDSNGNYKSVTFDNISELDSSKNYMIKHITPEVLSLIDRITKKENIRLEEYIGDKRITLDNLKDEPAIMKKDDDKQLKLIKAINYFRKMRLPGVRDEVLIERKAGLVPISKEDTTELLGLLSKVNKSIDFIPAEKIAPHKDKIYINQSTPKESNLYYFRGQYLTPEMYNFIEASTDYIKNGKGVPRIFKDLIYGKVLKDSSDENRTTIKRGSLNKTLIGRYLKSATNVPQELWELIRKYVFISKEVSTELTYKQMRTTLEKTQEIAAFVKAMKTLEIDEIKLESGSITIDDYLEFDQIPDISEVISKLSEQDPKFYELYHKILSNLTKTKAEKEKGEDKKNVDRRRVIDFKPKEQITSFLLKYDGTLESLRKIYLAYRYVESNAGENVEFDESYDQKSGIKTDDDTEFNWNILKMWSTDIDFESSDKSDQVDKSISKMTRDEMISTIKYFREKSGEYEKKKLKMITKLANKLGYQVDELRTQPEDMSDKMWNKWLELSQQIIAKLSEDVQNESYEAYTNGQIKSAVKKILMNDSVKEDIDRLLDEIDGVIGLKKNIKINTTLSTTERRQATSSVTTLTHRLDNLSRGKRSYNKLSDNVRSLFDYKNGHLKPNDELQTAMAIGLSKKYILNIVTRYTVEKKHKDPQTGKWPHGKSIMPLSKYEYDRMDLRIKQYLSWNEDKNQVFTNKAYDELLKTDEKTRIKDAVVFFSQIKGILQSEIDSITDSIKEQRQNLKEIEERQKLLKKMGERVDGPVQTESKPEKAPEKDSVNVRFITHHKEIENVDILSETSTNSLVKKLLATSYSKVKMSKVQLATADQENIISNSSEFYTQNADAILSASLEEIQEAAEWFLTAKVRNTEDHMIEARRLNSVRLYFLGYVLQQSDVDGVYSELDKTTIRKLKSRLNELVSDAGLTMALWKTVLSEVDPFSKMKNAEFVIDGVVITDDEKDEIFEAALSGDIQKITEVQEKVLERISAEKKPKSVLSKIHSFRIVAMLSSPITMLRNVTSNIALRKLNKMSDNIGKVLWKTKDNINGQLKLDVKASQEIKDYVTSNFVKNGLFDHIVDNISRYNPSEQSLRAQRFSDKDTEKKDVLFVQMVIKSMYGKYYNQNTFDSKFMNDVYHKIMSGLSDKKYVREAAIDYVNRIIAEKSISDESYKAALTGDKVSDEIMEDFAKSIGFALRDYMHSDNIFHDINKLFAEKGEIPNFIWQTFTPFFASSWNWAKAAMQMSPLGLVRSIVKMTRLEKNIAKTQELWEQGKTQIAPELAEYIAKRELGQGIIGTILWGTGLILAAMGLFKLEYDDYGTPKLKVGPLEIDVSSIFGSNSMLSAAALVTTLKNEGMTVDGWLAALNSSVDVVIDSIPLMQIIELDMYSQGGFSMGFDYLESMAMSYIPNLIKWISGATYLGNLETNNVLENFLKYVPVLNGLFLEKEINPYTGDPRDKWSGIFNRFVPYFSIDSASRIEKNSKALGMNKSQILGNYEINGVNFKVKGADLTNINKSYGMWNAADLEKFYNDYLDVEILVDNKYKTLSYNDMNDEQRKKAVQRIMEKNASYAKILAWTTAGNKYYASASEYILLKNLGVTKNVYRGSSGFVNK